MNNYLYHSGAKGMKWGIRKDSKRTASLRQQYRSEKIDGFYVYTSKKDSKKYNTLLVGEHVLRQKMASPMERILNPNKDKSLYRKTFQATDKIKIASPNEFNKTAAVLAVPYAAISGHKQNNDTVNLASEYFRKHKNSTIGLHEAAKNEEESRNKALREKYSSYSY